MSKQFVVAITVAILLGLGFLHFALTQNCKLLDTHFSNDCQQNPICKIKVIKTQEEVEKEAKEKGILGITGPVAITQCVPVYKFW